MKVQTGGRQILVHGLLLILAGLLWGLVVPHTPYPRLALTAHTQFEISGMFLLLLALVVLKIDHRAGPKSIAVMVASAWLIWPMALSEVANAWWGATQMLPIAAAQAGASGAAPWQETVVKLAHIIPGFAVIAAVAVLTVGVLRANTSPAAADASEGDLAANEV